MISHRVGAINNIIQYNKYIQKTADIVEVN
jgi:hypothetical protein